jgi:hypothetical protein
MTARLTDDAIRAALGPAPEIVAPDRFLSSVMAGIDSGGEALRRVQSTRSRGGAGSMRWRWLLALLALLLALAATALVVGSSLRKQQTPAPTGVFEPTGQIPNASDLQRPAVASLQDGDVLIAGGNTNEAVTAIVYDATTGTWGEPIRMRTSRWDATATTLADGRALVVGGMNPATSLEVGSAEIFDPATATFTEAGSLVAARADHTATLLDDGRVLIAGGQQYRDTDQGSVGQPIAPVELYDPAVRTFSTARPMEAARTGHTATLLSDGTVLIVGGYGRADDGTYAPTASAEVFDPGTLTFSSVGAMDTARARHTATLMPDGRVLIVGGGTELDTDGSATQVTPTAEIYDPTTRSFVPVGPLETERTGHSATLLGDGRVLVAGGENLFGGPLSAELFDPATDSFAAGGKASTSHGLGVAPLLPDGRVLLPAAWGSELYDPNGRSADGRAEPSMTAPTASPSAFQPLATTIRERHTTTLLADGRVLIAGGFGGPDRTDLATAEIFDPRTDAFTLTGSMAVARSGAVATRLPDGRVLIVSGDPARSAEAYDPSTGMFETAAPEVTRWLSDDTRPITVPGLTAGRLALVRYLEGDGTEPSEVFMLIDATDGREIASTGLCGSFHQWGSPAAMARDGRILILCGPGEPAQLFDPATGATEPAGIRGDWVAATPLADGRVALATARWEGDDPTAILAISALFDPVSGTLDELVPGSATSLGGRAWQGRYVPMAELTDGTVLLAGGSGGLSGPSDAARLLDPETGETHDPGPMLASRWAPSVTALDDGRALIVGGATQPPDRTDPIPPAAELFDLQLAP